MWRAKEGSLRWCVEYEFGNTASGLAPFCIYGGFETEEEAKAWAAENTEDGVVSWTEEMEWMEV